MGWSIPQDTMEASILWEKYGYQFLGSPHKMGFAAFSLALGYWLENQCISHVMKYTIELESDRKEAPILWEKYEYQYPRFPHSMSFAAFTQTMENWWQDWYIFSMLILANFFLWKPKTITMKSNYGDLHRNRTIFVSEWLVMNYCDTSYGHFWQNGRIVAFFYSRPKVKMRLKKMKDFVFIFL